MQDIWPLITTGIAGWLGVELVKFFAARKKGFSDEDREILRQLYRMHDKVDKDGTPVWYNKSELADNVRRLLDTAEEFKREAVTITGVQAQLLKQLHEISLLQKETAVTLSAVLERLRDKQ